MTPSYRIVFMGTPEFAVPALKNLYRCGHRVLQVVTQPDRPKGRGKTVVFPRLKRLRWSWGARSSSPSRFGLRISAM